MASEIPQPPRPDPSFESPEEAAKREAAGRRKTFDIEGCEGAFDYHALNLDREDEGSVRQLASAAAVLKKAELPDVPSDAEREGVERFRRIADGAEGEGLGDARKSLLRRVEEKRDRYRFFPGQGNDLYLEGLLKSSTQFETPARSFPSLGECNIRKLKGFREAALGDGNVRVALEAFLVQSRHREIRRAKTRGETISFVDLETQDPTGSKNPVERLGRNKSAEELYYEIADLESMLKRADAVRGKREKEAKATLPLISDALGGRREALKIAQERERRG